MLYHQKGNMMSFIVTDCKMDSVLKCYTIISDIEKQTNKKNTKTPNKDTENLN